MQLTGQPLEEEVLTGAKSSTLSDNDMTENLLLLNEIGDGLKEVQANLNVASVSLYSQGETIEDISTKYKDTTQKIKESNDIITSNSRKEYCHMLILHIIAIVLFLLIITSIIFKLLMK